MSQQEIAGEKRENITTNQIVTGHEAELAAVNEEAAALRAHWDALTGAGKEQYRHTSREQFDADCAAIGHTPFWA